MVVSTKTQSGAAKPAEIVQLQDIVVRFAGDSGDGMQLAGTQLTNTSAISVMMSAHCRISQPKSALRKARWPV